MSESLALQSSLARGWPYWPVALVLALGVLGTLILFSVVWRAGARAEDAEFGRQIEQRQRVIQGAFDRYQDMMSTVSVYLEGSRGQHSDKDFSSVVSEILVRYEGVQAIDFAPRIQDSGRHTFEAAVQASLHPHFQIYERTPQGAHVRAGRRSEYFPLLNVAPLRGNEMLIGFDLGAERRAVLDRARDSDSAQATGPTTLMQRSDAPQDGLIVAAPVYRFDNGIQTVAERRANLIGFAVAAFRVGEMFNAIMRARAVPNAFDEYVFFGSTPTSATMVHVFASQPGRTARVAPAFNAAWAEGSNTKTADFAGQTWSIVSMPLPGRFSHSPNSAAWAVLAIGLFLTVLGGRYLHNATHSMAGAQLAGKALKVALGRVQLHLEAMGKIGQADEIASGDVEGLARKITELAAATIGCERVNVWLFDADETILRCIDLYEATPARHSSGEVLTEQEFRNEFKALKNSKFVDADDPLTDERTSGYVEGYLKPLRITSMLDTVVRIAQQNVGLICFEHVDKAHHWREDEKSFASHIADKFGLAVAVQSQRKVEKALRESRHFLEDILDAIPVRVFWKDKNLAYLGANAAFARDAGFAEPEELVGKDDYQMAWRAQADLYRRDDRNVIDADRPKILIEEVQTAIDGGVRTLLTNKVPLRDSAGEVHGVIGAYLDITSYKRTEDLVRLQAEQFAAILATTDDGFWILDASGKFVAVNDRYCSMTGYSREELLKLRVQDIDVTESTQESSDHFAKIVARGFDHFETRHRRKDGSVFELEASVSFLRKIGQFLVFGRDITDRKRVDDELRQSNERLGLATKSAQIGIWDWNVVANKLTWDDRMFELYGIRTQDFSGAYDAWQAGLHPDDKAANDVAIQAALRNEKEFSIEFRVLWPNGEVHNIEAHALVKRAADGSPVRMTGVNWDITDRKRSQDKISQMARNDALTGLANRRAFVEALDQAMARANREKKGFAVLYLDLDHFKDINDTLGHPIGDLLLQAVSKRLQETMRQTDTVARFGGDEFAVIDSDVRDPAEVAEVATRLLKAMADPFAIAGNEIRTGTSIGISVFGPESPDAERLLGHADVALYRAKSEGRGTYRFFTEEMDAEVKGRVALGAELREGLAAGQIFLVYQPQVDIVTGEIIGVEALARWHHPTRGLVLPATFIPVAEKAGLIVALGHWVLLEACRQTKAWLDEGIAPPLVAVNVSALQFKTPLELETDIAGILAATGLPPQRLEIELTESILMGASSEHNDVLVRLRKAGIRLAIDDFGTGYSSLDYLRRFPVDRIKIAQNFILNLDKEPGNAAIVKAAIGLAHELKLDVMVEGVETARQLDLIKSWNCRKVQGYYFSKPVPAAEMSVLLQRGKILRAPELIALRPARISTSRR